MYLEYLGLIAIHIFLGRKLSVPYGIGLGLNPLIVGTMAFMLDMAQIPVLLYLYTSSSKSRLIQRLSEKIHERKLKIRNGILKDASKKFGKLGVVILVAKPIQGGGMWSGVLITVLLGMNDRERYPLLALGSILGILVLIFGTEALIVLIKGFF
ncbi:MAG: small multi-drug export protein [Candidatus Methanofastidiosia archaeon]